VAPLWPLNDISIVPALVNVPPTDKSSWPLPGLDCGDHADPFHVPLNAAPVMVPLLVTYPVTVRASLTSRVLPDAITMFVTVKFAPYGILRYALLDRVRVMIMAFVGMLPGDALVQYGVPVHPVTVMPLNTEADVPPLIVTFTTFKNVYIAVVAVEALPRLSQAITEIEVPGEVVVMETDDPTVPVEQVGADGGVRPVAVA
jgi:hypothetical protein